ncbi:MAG: MFS transporter [Desulfitobacteriia bacterium]|jgi:MFS family permease
MIVFAGLLLGMFSIGVMQLILATALPFIVAEIGGGELYSWIFSSYMLASIFTIPLFSKLADIYGKKRFFLLGIGVFALGSFAGGFAPDISHLIAARTIQGLGAGMITPVSLAMVTDMFPPEKRANMIGTFAFAQLLANLLSPPLGSFITKELGWMWIFFLNFGMVILAGLGVAFGAKHQERKALRKAQEIDLAGGLIFGAFCTLTVGFSNLLSKRSYWDITGTLLLLAAIACAIILFLIERKHPDPVIKIDFLKTKIIRSSIISAILAGAIMYGLVTILPLCGIILSKQGFQLDESKLLLFFMIGISAGLLSSSRLVGKYRFRHFTKLLWVMMLAGAAIMFLTVYSKNLTFFSISTILVGLCTGGVMATFLINSQNAVNSEDRTVLSGLIQLSRYFGASLGVTFFTGMLPEVSLISTIGQFLAPFGLLISLCLLGLINELL